MAATMDFSFTPAPSAPAMSYSPRGTKRRPEDELLADQPLSKRLELLSLYQNLNTPLRAQSRRHTPQRPKRKPKPHTLFSRPTSPAPPAHSRSPSPTPYMDIDSTPTKTFIANLDDELSTDDESDVEEVKRGVVFLPDVEKRFMGIPMGVLREKRGMEVVRYGGGWRGRMEEERRREEMRRREVDLGGGILGEVVEEGDGDADGDVDMMEVED